MSVSITKNILILIEYDIMILIMITYYGRVDVMH